MSSASVDPEMFLHLCGNRTYDGEFSERGALRDFYYFYRACLPVLVLVVFGLKL
jgi:hypothetical protein